jgi:integrase
MAITPETRLEELERIKGELRELMPLLSKWRVEELRTLISRFHETRWARHKFAKYGALNKGFEQNELEAFLGAIKEDRFRLLFSYQAFLGLRIGEVCKLNLADFDFRIKELKVHSEKSHFLDTLRVPSFLWEQTLEYVRKNEKQIESAEGYIFYKDKRKTKNEKPYLNLNYVRNVFRHYVSLTGLNETYAETEETIPNRAKRTLHRLSSHSLRHYAITTFNKSVNGNIILTKAFARHRSVGTTQIYIHTDKAELYGAIERAFIQNSTKKIEVRL